MFCKSKMSATMWKQIARSLRHNLKCKHYFMSSRSIITTALERDEQVVEYPPVKPRLPPGTWGEMDRKQCWTWYELQCELQEMSNVQDKINKLTEQEFRTWTFDVHQRTPRTYEYQQSVTKTHVVKNLPSAYDQSSDLGLDIERLRPLIIEEILLKHYHDRTEGTSWKSEEKCSRVLLKNILHVIYSVLLPKYKHLQLCQMDENVQVEAFWDRHGIQRHLPKIINKEQYVRPQNARIQSKYVADFQIRLERPLPEFIPRDDSLCTEGEYPEMKYWPTVLGQRAATQKHSSLSGYKYGDPCEFGLLSVLITNSQNESLYGPEHADLLRKGYGLASSFVWLVAQAYNQGFNTCQDLTYPFTTQTVLTDGKRFSFFAYQLNTLHLWKDDKAQPLRNICWHSDDMHLYERIENDEVVGFNDDVLKQLVRCLVMQPSDKDFDTSPNLSREVEDRTKKTDFVKFKVEEIVVEDQQVYDES